MIVVNQKDFVAGLLYVAIGAAVAIASMNYPIGSADRMGAGYFPLCLGGVLALVGVGVLVGAVKSGTPAKIGALSLRNLAIVLVSVVLFGLLVERAGLVIAIPVLLGVSSLAHPEFSWRVLLLSIAVLLPFTWVVFILVLGLQFPMLPAFLTK